MKQLIGLVLVFAIGCTKRAAVEERVLSSQDVDWNVTLLLDMSGSFEQMMAEDGYAWKMALAIVDKYFRDRIGNNDRLVIAQISGNERTLLFEGSPHALRKTFGTGGDFAAFLRKKSDRGGSAVHKAIGNSLEYVMDRPFKRSMLIVLSDMMSTESPDSREKAVDAIRQYGRHGGVVALYYVAQHLVPGWKADLGKAGLREFCVESEIVARPELPEWVEVETVTNMKRFER